MNTKILNLLLALLLLLPFAIIGLYYQQIPETFPVHWDISGQPDRFSSNKLEIFTLPVINLVIALFMFLIPKIAAKPNFSLFETTYHKLIIIMAALFSSIFMVQFDAIMWQVLPTDAIIYVLLLFFLIFGNYLGKVRPNYFVGIRTPWTLESEQVWIKTHRLTGMLWALSSLIMLVLKIIIPMTSFIYLLGIYLVVIITFPFVYSFLAFKKEKSASIQ